MLAIKNYLVENLFSNILLILIYIYTFFSFFSRSMWDSNMPHYVFSITKGSNSDVGKLTGIYGFVQLFIAPVVGYIGDKVPRTWILMLASIIGFIAISLIFYAVQMENYLKLLYGMIAMGFFLGCTTSTIDAILADIIEDKNKPDVFTKRSLINTLATSFGYLINCILFYFIGNNWSLEGLKMIISIGLSFLIISCIILFSFHFNYKQQNNDELLLNIRKWFQDIIQCCYFRKKIEINKSNYNKVNNDEIDNNKTDLENNELINSSGETHSVVKEWWLFIVCMIILADILMALASGMTIKMFPIFFMIILFQSPMNILTISFISQIMIFYFTIKTKTLSEQYGRLYVTIGVKCCGIILLFLMAMLVNKRDSYSYSDNRILDICIIIIHIFRTGFMNCTYGLSKSIVMELVPKDQRGRWSSLESICSFSYSGSAFIGGFLVDKIGFVWTFVITAITQIVACIPLIIIQIVLGINNIKLDNNDSTSTITS